MKEEKEKLSKKEINRQYGNPNKINKFKDKKKLDPYKRNKQADFKQGARLFTRA